VLGDGLLDSFFKEMEHKNASIAVLDKAYKN
jgi:hypothetical protein